LKTIQHRFTKGFFHLDGKNWLEQRNQLKKGTPFHSSTAQQQIQRGTGAESSFYMHAGK